MLLLLREQNDERRLRVLAARVQTEWTFRAWDRSGGKADFADALADADAVVSMSWRGDLPPAPKLRLIQLPGAGLDGIDFGAVPVGCAVCNVYEHEIGISEYVVAAVLEWEIRLSRLDAGLPHARTNSRSARAL